MLTRQREPETDGRRRIAADAVVSRPQVCACLRLHIPLRVYCQV